MLIRTLFVTAWLALVWQPTAAGAAAAASRVASITSPGDVLEVEIGFSGEGRAVYRVNRLGRPVLGDSELGFLFTDAPQILRQMTLVSQSVRESDDTWQQPWGEWTSIRNHYRELTVRLAEKGRLHRVLDVVFRVYDDGVGFRYAFPEQPHLREARIAEELTQFRVAEPATAWWCTAFESNREEYAYHRTPIAEIGIAQTPLTIRTASGLHVSFHEAALVDYSGMNLAKVEGGLLKAVLTPSSTGPKVVRTVPFTTPWRTITVSPDAAGLYTSHLILNLNEPNALGDVSWVRPRKYVGIWWGMHLGENTWASGVKHGATTRNTLAMIDFAAKYGFGGVLVEGWNKGWDGDWFADGSEFSFTEPYADFDLPTITAYAKSKGIRLIGHHETSANIANYESQLAAALDLDARLGIDSIKTGYVADAGGVQARGADGAIHFEWHEGQVMARHHLTVVTEAAKRHVSVIAHEPIKDTGLRRTYPNWVSREGQRGMEYNAWGNPKNPPEHEANLVFTRMLGGPMDFTPGILSLRGAGNTDIPSTIAKQLALYVVIYSPVQMAADLPVVYEQNLAAFQFIRDVPTDWSDTRVLNGEVGEYVTLVRKDRGSADWYLGSLTDASPRSLEVALDFLDEGQVYRARIYRDGPGADYRTDGRHSIAIETRDLRRGDRLTLALAPGGGTAIRFAALRRAR